MERGGGYKMGSFTLMKTGGEKSFNCEGGGGQKVSTLQMEGGGRVLPCLEGGGARKVSDPRFSHFVAPPPSYFMISP